MHCVKSAKIILAREFVSTPSFFSQVYWQPYPLVVKVDPVSPRSPDPGRQSFFWWNLLILSSFNSLKLIYGKKASFRATTCHWHRHAVQGDGPRNEGKDQSGQHFCLLQRSHLEPNGSSFSAGRQDMRSSLMQTSSLSRAGANKTGLQYQSRKGKNQTNILLTLLSGMINLNLTFSFENPLWNLSRKLQEHLSLF